MKQLPLLLIALLWSNAEALDLRLVSMPTSQHFFHASSQNQNHHGLGFEVKMDDGNWWYGGMNFINSQDDPARLFTMSKEKDNGWGVVYGFATGYESVAILPVAGISYRWKFLRIVVTPVVAVTNIVIPL